MAIKTGGDAEAKRFAEALFEHGGEGCERASHRQLVRVIDQTTEHTKWLMTIEWKNPPSVWARASDLPN